MYLVYNINQIYRLFNKFKKLILKICVYILQLVFRAIGLFLAIIVDHNHFEGKTQINYPMTLIDQAKSNKLNYFKY
jgi:hypothetical protein